MEITYQIISLGILFLFIMILSFLNNSINSSKAKPKKKEPGPDHSNSPKKAFFVDEILEHSTNAIALMTSELDILFANKTFNKLFRLEKTSNDLPNFEKEFPFGANHPFIVAIKKYCAAAKDNFPISTLKAAFPTIDNSEQKSDYFVLLRPHSPKNSSQKTFVMWITVPQITRAIEKDLKNSLDKAEEDLKKLEELDKLKSEFLATCSHELKTPLVSIKGYLDLISSEKLGPLSDKQRKALNVSLRNASNLNTLISSMLNFARMEAGKLKFDLIPQKIGPLLKNTAESIKPISDNKDIKVKIDLEEELPSVIIDAALLNRVLLNILENAIKFSPKDSEIILKAGRASQQYVQVELIDHGIGIAPEQIEQIKNPFFQIDKSDTRRTGGLGLGLAIAERILIGHGTTLHIESEENKGTSVSFNLSVKETVTTKKPNPFG